MGVLIWLAAGGLVLASAVLLRERLRLSRVRQAAQALPPGLRREVLETLQGLPPGKAQLLVPSEDGACSVVDSHLGGQPYAEEGEGWPEANPGWFLIQVRLAHPGLGPAWQGRLVVVFHRHDEIQVVRSYAAPTAEKARPLEGARRDPLVPLTALNLPPGGYDSEVLLREAPRLRELLEPHVARPERVLARVLEPVRGGLALYPDGIVLVGGEPELIQNPHPAECDACHEPMRFLFQFGEVLPGVDLADSAVTYVYGCDRHPERCLAFMDSH